MSNQSNEADWKRLYSLVDEFSKRQDCEPFRDPVPWKALGLTDYPILISRPMDLGTVKKKIKNKEYTSLSQCGDDIRLIWSNCMVYNADGSDFYKLAQSLHKRWDTIYSKFLNDIGVKDTTTTGVSASAGSQAPSTTTTLNGPTSGGTSTGSGNTQVQPQHSNDRKVTLQEKRNLAKSFYQITKEDLGKVLIEIEKKCPAAIKRNSSEDELELNMDLIDASLMSYLVNYVQGLKSSGKKKPNPGSNKSSKSGSSGSKKQKAASEPPATQSS